MSQLVWCHGQNLDERPGDGHCASGHWWKNSRFWVHFGQRATIAVQWVLFSRSCGIGISAGEDISFVLNVPLLFGLYVTIEGLRLPWARRWDDRDLSIRIFDWSVWVNLWCVDGHWSPRERFWHKHRRRFTWHPLDTIFGRTKYSEETLDHEDIVVPMPEGNYRGRAVRKRETWKRPRLPFVSTRLVRVHVDMIDPVPFPGKGENSWDCGEDALHGQTSPASTYPEAVAQVVKSVMTSRRNYGGPSWRPEERIAGEAR